MPDIALVVAHDADPFSLPPLAFTTLQTDAYVLFTASLPVYYAASASPPSNTIHLLDKRSLRPIHTLPGHNPGTTGLRSVSSIAGTTRDVLISSGKDGAVKVWDERAPPNRTAVITMTPAGKPRALLCCDVSPNGLTVAAGSELSEEDAFISYWDPRRPASPLRTHSSTHSDDITAVNFSPSHPTTFPHPVLLSASSDGLIAISDPSEDDEDESVQRVANWGCSVAQVGWTPHSKTNPPQVWAASDMETFSTWSNELDPLLSVDIRSPSVHTQQRTWVTDYFITCPTTSYNASPAPTTDLNAFVGSNEGDVALISIPSDPTRSTWTLRRLWTHGHVGVVRSALYDEENSLFITGGEDSKINLWPCPPLPSPEPSDQVDTDSSQESDSDREMDVDFQDSPGTARVQLTHQDVKKRRRMSD